MFRNNCVLDAYLGNSGHHVSDEGLESGDCSCLSVACVPHSESNVLALSALGRLVRNFYLN